MKKIVIAAAAMGGAALVAFGASGTFAAFQDQSTQSLAAGAGSLRLGIDRPATLPASAGNLAPGQSVIVPFFVQNAGNGVAGNVGVALQNVQNQDNYCSSVSERTAESGACDSQTTTGGEFGALATYQIGRATAKDAQACRQATTPDLINYVTFPALNGVGLAPKDSPIQLKAGDSACMLLKIALPDTVGDIVQGDSMSFDAVVTLAQQGPVSARLDEPNTGPGLPDNR